MELHIMMVPYVHLNVKMVLWRTPMANQMSGWLLERISRSNVKMLSGQIIIVSQSLMVSGLIGLVGINVRRHVGVVFTGEPEPAPIQVLHMVELNVMDWKMKGEIVILLNAQLMAIGVFGLYGRIVARHVVAAKDPVKEPAPIQVHSMVEKTAKELQLKLEIATCKDVPLTGAGVLGPVGVRVATHVDLGSGPEAETATNQGHETMEKIVKERRLKLKTAALDFLKVIHIPAPIVNWALDKTTMDTSAKQSAGVRARGGEVFLLLDGSPIGMMSPRTTVGTIKTSENCTRIIGKK